jgi:hypothetical protein
VGLAKMSRDKFSLVISLVKVNKSLCHVTQGGGGVRRNVTKCLTGGEGGSKKCGKSVTYYLNGPIPFVLKEVARYREFPITKQKFNHSGLLWLSLGCLDSKENFFDGGGRGQIFFENVTADL